MEATVTIHQFAVLPLFPAPRRHTAPAPAPGPALTKEGWAEVGLWRPGVDSGVHAHTVLCALSGTQPWAETTQSPNTAPPNRAQLKQLKPSSGPFLWRSNAMAEEVLNLIRSPTSGWRPPSIDLHGWKGRPKIQSQDTYSAVHLFSLQMRAEYHVPGTLLGVEFTPRKHAHL